MADYYITYRNIEDYGLCQAFEQIEPLQIWTRVIKERIVPGWLGAKPVYIRWYHQQFERDRLHLATYTHSELTLNEVEGLSQQAIELIREQRLQ